MVHEIETKVLDIDLEALKKKLVALGAQPVQETRLTVDWFRIKGTKVGLDPWFLRIRSYSNGKNEVTWKAKSDILGTARRHKEINFLLAEPDKLADLFIEIGLEKYAHQEKDRLSFSYQDWQFDIDKYPGVPVFLEIEGNSDDHVKQAIKLLGLENNRTWAQGERLLIEEVYKLDWYNMQF